MSTDIVPFSVDQLPAVSEERLAATEVVASETSFLPRLQLISKGKYVDTGKITPGRWGAPAGDEITDLGETIDVLPLSVRTKALDVSDRDNIIAVYDETSDEFQRIKKAPKNTGCMWGLSYLVLERQTQKLYELFFGNASGRAEAPKLKAFLPREGRPPRVATLGIKYKKTKDYGWHVPVVNKCSEPIEGGPAMPAVIKAIETFNNPKAVEVVEEPATERAR